MFKKLNNKGYNLMELIVVIIIIGVLVAMAVPKYLDHKKDADAAVLQADIKTVQNAADIYEMVHGKTNLEEKVYDGEEKEEKLKLQKEEEVVEENVKGHKLNIDVLKDKEGNIKSIKNNKTDFYRTKDGNIFVEQKNAIEKSDGTIINSSPGLIYELNLTEEDGE